MDHSDCERFRPAMSRTFAIELVAEGSQWRTFPGGSMGETVITFCE